MTSRFVSISRRGVLRKANYATGICEKDGQPFRYGVSRPFRKCRGTAIQKVPTTRWQHASIMTKSLDSTLSNEAKCDERPQHCDNSIQQRTLKDAYLICNHNLSNLQSSSDLVPHFSSCGTCNVLGNYDVNGYLPVLRDKTNNSFKSDVRSPTRTVSLHRYSSLLSTNSSDTNWLILRSFHTSPFSFKEESKAEQTIKVLKDEAKLKMDSTEPQPTPAAAATEPEPSPTPKAKTSVEEPPKAVAPVKKSIKERVIAEVKHYYHGFRLLYLDVKVCMRSVWQVLNGKSLSRRERRQLVRTTSDMFRLVPFLVFIVVPFMEFLLPVALKLFPGMLPSTFAEANKEQEKMRKRLKVKLELAKFLQDTIEETALTQKGATGENVQEFVDFMGRIRTSGQETSNEEIIKYSKLFDEDITLDNLNHGQLRALLGLLDMPAVGTNNFLKFKLRMKLRQLEADDKMIKKEGLDGMTVWELQEACRARGMRALGVPKERLQNQLSQWLDLHLNENIPTSLLVMSRALYLPEELSKEEQLKATISALPETTAEEAKVKISEVTGERVDHKTKVELLKQEEEAIRKEAEEAKAKEEAKKAEAQRAEEEVDKAEVIAEPPDVIKAAAEPITPTLVDSAPELKPSPDETLVDKAEPLGESAEAEEISKVELEEIEDVLEKVAEEKSVNLEKDELDALKEDVSEYKEALEDLREVVLSSWGASRELEESVSAKRLSKRVNKMVSQMDAIMQGLNKEKSALMEDIEIKEVRMKRSSELKEDDHLRQDMLDQISETKKNVVGINELLLAIRRIQKVPDDTKYQRIVQVLDEDQDGVIDINDALKVIELLGRENVSVQADHMMELMDLLQRESEIEQQDKEEKIREKMEKQKQQEQADTAEGVDTEAPSGELEKAPGQEVDKKEQKQKQ